MRGNRCPECGEKMGVTRSKRYLPRAGDLPPGPAREREKTRDLFLARLYCSADCLLDARQRGYPRYRYQTVAALMSRKETKK